MAKEKEPIQDLDTIIKNINKKSGASIAHFGLSKRTYKRIPFTSPRMNYCTYGGLPEGRLIEYYGEEHGGKTTTALDNLANFQQIDDRAAAYLDAENTLDPEWAEKLGVDLDRTLIIQPEFESAEELLDYMLELIQSGKIGFGIIDSVPALIPKNELDGDISDSQYAGNSMPVTKFVKKAELLCKKSHCTLILINQLREDLRSIYPGATRTPGGKALKHFCSVRMEFRHGAFLNERGDEIKKSAESPAGNVVLMSMDKNKTCPPNRRGGFYSIDYANGINYLRDLVDVALKYDMIQKSGAWFTIIDPDTGEVKSEKIQGMPNVYEYLKQEENEKVLTFIEDYIDSKI